MRGDLVGARSRGPRRASVSSITTTAILPAHRRRVRRQLLRRIPDADGRGTCGGGQSSRGLQPVWRPRCLRRLDALKRGTTLLRRRRCARAVGSVFALCPEMKTTAQRTVRGARHAAMTAAARHGRLWISASARACAAAAAWCGCGPRRSSSRWPAGSGARARCCMALRTTSSRRTSTCTLREGGSKTPRGTLAAEHFVEHHAEA